MKFRDFIGNLKHALRRDKKVYITDEIIQNFRSVDCDGCTDEENDILRDLARQVLVISKEKNDSNEVAITCDWSVENPRDKYGVATGDEHTVNVFSDMLSNYLIASKDAVAVVVLHNYPSMLSFSLRDIVFFLKFSNIKIMLVVSKRGTIHYMRRMKNYDEQDAIDLFKECTEDLNSRSSKEDWCFARLLFLAECSTVGLRYQ